MYSSIGEMEQLSHTPGPQILGALPVDSEPPITGRMQAQPPGMLRRESPMVTLHGCWTLGWHY